MGYQVGSVEVALETKFDKASKSINDTLKSLKNLKSGLKQTQHEIKNTGKQSDRLGNSLKTAFSVGKMYVALNYVRRYGRAIGKVVKSSIDYVETVNKFRVSMVNMYEDSIKFQNKVNERFGISKSILMDYQANFNNIIRGLGGIDRETAYGLSETLTKMSIDFSSLFNTSLEGAVTKFQAALTQQVRPIRSVSGFDITQQTLKGVLQSIGITDRYVSSLSQVEKRLLIIISLQKQMANVGAAKDFARTIEQPANQLKIMQQIIRDIGIELGYLVTQRLAPILAYINGFFMVVKEIIQFLSLGGISNEETKDMPNLNDLLNTDGATSGVNGTTAAIKKLKNATTGIDELNIISPQDDSDKNGGGLGGGLGAVDPRILAAIQEYDNALERVRMKATDIRDRIMEWLGFTKIVDEKTGEVNFKLKEGYTNLEKIRDIIKIIGGLITIHFGGKVLGKIGKGISGFIKGITTLKGASFLSKIGQVFALTAKGAGTFKESLLVVFPLIGKIGTALSAAAGALGVSVGGLIAIIAGVIAAIISVVYAIFHWDEIKVYLENFGEWAKEKWTDLKDWFSKSWKLIKESVSKWFAELPHKLGYALGVAIGTIKNWGNDVVNWFKELPTRIYNALMTLKEKIYAWADNVKKWFTEKLPQILNTVVEWFKTLPQKIVTIGRNIVTALWNGIVSKWQWLKNKFHSILGWFKDAANEFKSGYQEGYESVAGYATGGFPTRGDYFLANENGKPEYVGSMGGKTAVANTTQIVDGISIGVSRANAVSDNLLRQNNALLQQLINKDMNTYLDGRLVNDQLQKSQNSRGFNAVIGGAAFV